MLMLLATLSIASAGSAYAVIVARFTGVQEQVMSATGQLVIKCQYDYVGQKFYKLVKASCPSTIEVE